LTVKGLTYSERPTGAYALLLESEVDKRRLPIVIGAFEAQAIAIALDKMATPPRPMTHDLFLRVLEKANITVDRVEITDLKDRTFYSRLVMKQGMKKLVVDSRPSDSLGIATRVHCPVFIAESIVDEAGVAVNLITEIETQLGDGDPLQ